MSATSSIDWPSRWVSTLAPSAPASFQVSGLPAVVTQIGSSFETGRGCVTTAKGVPEAVGNSNRLPAPEPAQLVDRLVHRRLVGRRSVLGAEHEVVGLPAGGDREAGAAVGQVVDDRPLLGDARDVVERRDAAARRERSDCA